MNYFSTCGLQIASNTTDMHHRIALLDQEHSTIIGFKRFAPFNMASSAVSNFAEYFIPSFVCSFTCVMNAQLNQVIHKLLTMCIMFTNYLHKFLRGKDLGELASTISGKAPSARKKAAKVSSYCCAGLKGRLPYLTAIKNVDHCMVYDPWCLKQIVFTDRQTSR